MPVPFQSSACVSHRDRGLSQAVAYMASLSSVDGSLGTGPQSSVVGQKHLHMLAFHPSFLPSVHPKQVPDAIKSQYQFPPPLIAPAAIRDGELICNGIPEESQTHLLNSEHLATQAEQQEVSEDRTGLGSKSVFCHLTQLVLKVASVLFPSPYLQPLPLSPSKCSTDNHWLRSQRQVRQNYSQRSASLHRSQYTIRWAHLCCRKRRVALVDR